MKCQSCGAYLNPAWAKCLVCNTPTISKAKLEGCKLSDEERVDYNEYVEIMTSSKFNLPLDRAEREAMQLVLKAKRSLQARQTSKMEK